MDKLKKYTDEELFDILGSDVELEIKSRGYEFGWYKKVHYAGVIYILVNPAFPDLVKIGYTENIESRLKSLNRNSGLPDPFHVYATYKVKKKLEDLKLHSLIDALDSDLRHAKNREFYEMSPEKAFGILSAIAQINGDEELLIANPLNDDFFKEQTIVTKAKPAKPRRPKPPLTFAMLNIPIGSELVYSVDPSVSVITADNKNTVLYHETYYTMSGFVAMMKGGGSWQGSDYLLYQGIKLTKLRKQIEKEQDKERE